MKCEKCKFAQPFIDPFNQKQRLYCGKGLQIIDNFGDSMLISSEYVTDCEYGEPIEEKENENCS